MATADTEERRRLAIASIPTGGYQPAPAADGRADTELSRNASNAFNAITPAVGGASRIAAGGLRLAASTPVNLGMPARVAIPATGAAALAGDAPNALPIAEPAASSAAPLSIARPVAAGAVPPADPPLSIANWAPPLTDNQRGGGRVPGNPTAPTREAFEAGGVDVGFGTRRIDGGTSPLFTNVPDVADGAKLMNRGAPSAQNLAALDTLAGREQTESVARVRAGMNKEQYDREVAEAQSINERFNPPTQAQRQLRRLQLKEREEANRSASDAVRAGADARRASTDANRLALDAPGLGFDARLKDAQAQTAVQVLAARNAVINAKTPEARAAAETNLRTLQGSAANQRYSVVQGGQGIDPDSGRPYSMPSAVFDHQTREYIPQPRLGAPTAGTAPPAAAIQRLRGNPQEAALFDQKYGAGAAARALGTGR